MTSPLRPALRVLGYLALAIAITWPLALNLDSALPGYPNVDALDTVMLRGLVIQMLEEGTWPQSTGIYFPFGFPVGHLVPNLLDHLSGLPFDELFGFPTGDNLWWLTVFTLNGLAGHHLGRRVGGSELSGAVAGVAFAAGEHLLREANLHHAPQSMIFAAPMYLEATLRAHAEEGRPRDALVAGLWMALAASIYWYQALFLAFGTLPFIRRPRQLALAVLGSTPALLLLAPTLASWEELPLAQAKFAPPPVNPRDSLTVLPESLRFIFEHGTSPLFPFEPTPLDRTNRLSLLLLAGGAWVARENKRWWLLMLIGATFVLGPYLAWADEPVLIGGGPISLPFKWMGSLHPFLGRLTWPERWGVLLALGSAGLGALAAARLEARTRWAWLILPALVAETFVASGNAPLQTMDISRLSGWRALAMADGAVVELPLDRGGLQAPLVGLHARYHKKKLVNPTLLPPGKLPPAEWKRLLDEEPLLAYLHLFDQGEWPDDPGPAAIEHAAALGIGAIVVDSLPGSSTTKGRINRFEVGLSRHLGEPEDHGAVLIWWVRPPTGPRPPPVPDGQEWRNEAEDNPPEAPDLDTLIEPGWTTRKGKGFLESQ